MHHERRARSRRLNLAPGLLCNYLKGNGERQCAVMPRRYSYGFPGSSVVPLLLLCCAFFEDERHYFAREEEWLFALFYRGRGGARDAQLRIRVKLGSAVSISGGERGLFLNGGIEVCSSMMRKDEDA